MGRVGLTAFQAQRTPARRELNAPQLEEIVVDAHSTDTQRLLPDDGHDPLRVGLRRLVSVKSLRA